MKLIIDIPDELYNQLREDHSYNSAKIAYRELMNGKPYEERPQVECKDCKYFFDTVGRCDNCNRYHWYSDNFIRKQT